VPYQRSRGNILTTKKLEVTISCHFALKIEKFENLPKDELREGAHIR
jgi:hypothetical protein